MTCLSRRIPHEWRIDPNRGGRWRWCLLCGATYFGKDGDGVPSLKSANPARPTEAECFQMDHANRIEELEHRVRTAEAKVARVEGVLAMWDADETEHLNMFGQHLPASVATCADHLREALGKSQ